MLSNDYGSAYTLWCEDILTICVAHARQTPEPLQGISQSALCHELITLNPRRWNYLSNRQAAVEWALNDLLNSHLLEHRMAGWRLTHRGFVYALAGIVKPTILHPMSLSSDESRVLMQIARASEHYTTASPLPPAVAITHLANDEASSTMILLHLIEVLHTMGFITIIPTNPIEVSLRFIGLNFIQHVRTP